jgi:hypothetical protein
MRLVEGRRSQSRSWITRERPYIRYNPYTIGNSSRDTYHFVHGGLLKAFLLLLSVLDFWFSFFNLSVHPPFPFFLSFLLPLSKGQILFINTPVFAIHTKKCVRGNWRGKSGWYGARG